MCVYTVILLDAFTAISRDYGMSLSPLALPETITDDCFSMSDGPKSQEWKREVHKIHSASLPEKYSI